MGQVDTIPCFLRLHAQIYLELSDYRRLAMAVLTILNSASRDHGSVMQDVAIGASISHGSLLPAAVDQ
jgi:hypothetical protein